MHVLVTGIDGFSGKNISNHLLKNGIRVTGVGSQKSRKRTEVDGLTVLNGDLSGKMSLPNNIDAIIHTAASSPGKGIHLPEDKMIRDNVTATQNLVRHGVQSGISHFIYFSAFSVFGNVCVPVVDEKTAINNHTPYGKSKFLGELAVAEEASHFSSMSIRLPGILGPGSVRNLVTRLLTAAKEGLDIEYYNPDSLFNNGVHIDDIARFVTGLLSKKWAGADMVVVGAGSPMPMKEVVETIVRETGSRSKISEVTAKTHSFIINSSYAQDSYGYDPMSMRDILRMFLQENNCSHR